MLALVLQVIWNFGTEGLMNEFGGTGNRDGENIFGRVGLGTLLINPISVTRISPIGQWGLL